MNRIIVLLSLAVLVGVCLAQCDEFIGVACGEDHSMAITTSKVYSWGSNNSGMLGDGTTTDRSMAVTVIGPDSAGSLTNIIAIDAGRMHSIALASDGKVWTWGKNHHGQLGDGRGGFGAGFDFILGRDSAYPVQPVGPDSIGHLEDMIAISAGVFYCVAVRSDSTVWSWGLNEAYQLGNYSIDSTTWLPYPYSYTPIQVLDSDSIGFLTNIVGVACGGNQTLALASDSTAWAWGNNRWGQLGDGIIHTTPVNSVIPLHVVGPDGPGTGYLDNIVDIAAGWYHSIALRSDGTVWAWGQNYHGQLGINTTSEEINPIPVQVHGADDIGYLTDVIAISANGVYSLALKSDGTVWRWGLLPEQIVGPDSISYLKDIKAISAGRFHFVAINLDSTAWAWGYNHRGQLGDGTEIDRYYPGRVLCSGTGIIEDKLFYPEHFDVCVSPNPFNSAVYFSVGSSGGDCVIEVCDILGRKVRTVCEEPLGRGTQNIAWDGTDDAGQNLPSGVYYYTVKMGDSKRSGRLVLMK